MSKPVKNLTTNEYKKRFGDLEGAVLIDIRGISSNDKDPKAAAAFLEYLESPERLSVFWEKTGWIPST